jgi:two-component system chemotaxis response regulator CheB
VKHVVVIGTSAGGLEALTTLVRSLPADFPAPIAVVMHVAPDSPGVLPDLLTREGTLVARHPDNGERLEPGHIYVAPPDHHLLLEPDRACVSKGPRENRFRPAIDPLFRSAAQVYGPGAIGVILTGSLGDGTIGLLAIKKLGGVAVVQDPAEALYPSMPENALRHVAVDYSARLADIPALLVALASRSVGDIERFAVPPTIDVEVRIAREENPMHAGVEQLGKPSPLACPECHGVLREWEEDGRVRFRCHTGHAYSPESLAAEIDEAIETALWNAIRSLQEGVIFLQQFAGDRYTREDAEKLVARAQELERQADQMRELVTKEGSQRGLTIPPARQSPRPPR